MSDGYISRTMYGQTLELHPRSYKTPVRKKIGSMIPIFFRLLQNVYPLAWFYSPDADMKAETLINS